MVSSLQQFFDVMSWRGGPGAVKEAVAWPGVAVPNLGTRCVCWAGAGESGAGGDSRGPRACGSAWTRTGYQATD